MQAAETLTSSIKKTYILAFLKPQPEMVRDKDAIREAVPRMRGVHHTDREAGHQLG